MTTGRISPSAAVWLGKIYVMGGREFGDDLRDHALNSVEALNLTTGQWKEVGNENSGDK